MCDCVSQYEGDTPWNYTSLAALNSEHSSDSMMESDSEDSYWSVDERFRLRTAIYGNLNHYVSDIDLDLELEQQELMQYYRTHVSE